ncbi:hypothetical protein AAur_1166 [Paenarthrobacter aurescens TC1]|uniref:Uncharacterized protein n=1 Tax=Paenarthrobacter aurescens (strain TC1) TaxID=290340 RepID=A1R3Z0_PAEAT|nr:hypothetical protein AAur_1166 [Paenarthrobacter aurescens TC1]
MNAIHFISLHMASGLYQAPMSHPQHFRIAVTP